MGGLLSAGGLAWSPWSWLLMHSPCLPENSSWWEDKGMVVKARTIEGSQVFTCFRWKLPKLWEWPSLELSIQTSHVIEQQDNSLCQSPAPPLICRAAVQSWANALTPTNLFPQLIIVPTPLNTMGHRTQEWEALSIWRPTDARASFWRRKAGMKEIAFASCQLVLETLPKAALPLSCWMWTWNKQ